MPTSSPPGVAARLDRFAATRARSSLLAAAAATGCGPSASSRPGTSWAAPVRVEPRLSGRPRHRARPTSDGAARRAPLERHESYLGGLRKGYDVALRRLRAEAVALGADGVVGVRLQITDDVHGEAERDGWIRHDFVALGTAVRSSARTRPTAPFTTSLPGTDVAKLLLAGWAPVDVHVVIEIGSRHNDAVTIGQAQPGRMNRANVEVDGYTAVAQAVRASVGRKFRSRVAAAGASGGLLQSIATRTWHSPCTYQSDQVVQAVAVGDAIARFGPPRAADPAPLTVLPLRTGGTP